MHPFISYKTNILLPDYTQSKIYDLHKQNYRGDVLAIYPDGSVAATRVLSITYSGAYDNWVQTEVKLHQAGRGPNMLHLYSSPQQAFWSSNIKSFLSINKFNAGDKITMHRLDYDLSPLEEQILIGKNLGDASYSSRNPLSGYMTWQQVEAGYSAYALDLLRPSLRGRRNKKFVSGYGTTMYRCSTKDNTKLWSLFQDWYVTGHKEFPASFINKLNPIALAFWYMDDGSLAHNEDQWDRALFATNGFNEASLDNLIAALNRFDITAVKYQSNGWRIRLNADDAEKFFLLIAPYIHPDKAYKLPERYRHLVHNFVFEQRDEYKPTTLDLPITTVKRVEHPILSGLTPPDRRPKYHTAQFQICTEVGTFFGNNILLKDHSGNS